MAGVSETYAGLSPHEARIQLIATLQAAYSGELGAALAYEGHARSLVDHRERDEVREIGREEWEHRRAVGAMLYRLGAKPAQNRERLMRFVGRCISAFCRLSGWFAPMYGAGWLESGNVREYEDAARFATVLGLREESNSLLVMAEAEWEHERYFRQKVQSHWLSRVVPVWGELPPKTRIRERFVFHAPTRGFRAPSPRGLAASEGRAQSASAF
jgi:rubrerythrin